MDDINVLRKLDRVAAPPDFERQVLARLARRRAELPQIRRIQVFRYSLAGAAAAFLVCFLALNTFVLRSGPAGIAMADKDTLDSASAGGAVHITEPVSYRNEVRSVSYEPQTVYILEQVSSASNKYIRY